VEGTTGRIARKVGLASRLMLATAGVVAALGPIGLGIFTAGDLRAQAQSELRRNAQVPPESSDDSSSLLAQAREKIVYSTHRLPRFTCLETIERTYHVTAIEKMRAKIMTEAAGHSCDGEDFGAGIFLSTRGIGCGWE